MLSYAVLDAVICCNSQAEPAPAQPAEEVEVNEQAIDYSVYDESVVIYDVCHAVIDAAGLCKCYYAML